MCEQAQESFDFFRAMIYIYKVHSIQSDEQGYFHVFILFIYFYVSYF